MPNTTSITTIGAIALVLSVSDAVLRMHVSTLVITVQRLQRRLNVMSSVCCESCELSLQCCCHMIANVYQMHKCSVRT